MNSDHPTTSAAPPHAEDWLKALSTKHKEQDIAVLRRALALAAEAHRGQTRISGEPYVQHSLAVAQILAALNMDAETLTAAILHDVVEDTGVTLEHIHEQFGDTIARLVDGVTKLDKISGSGPYGELEERAVVEGTMGAAAGKLYPDVSEKFPEIAESND